MLLQPTLAAAIIALSLVSPVVAFSVQSTVLIFAKDATSSEGAAAGLNAYGIPYQVLTVPSNGTALPALTTNGNGNYGAFVVLSEVSYGNENAANGTAYESALSTEQWTALFEYQVNFGARMARLDVYPGPQFGTTVASAAAPGCCDTGVEQLIALSNTTAFAQANLVEGATVSSKGLYHYPALITDASMATEIAQFGPSGVFTNTTTAAVINRIGGREQMVWFSSWAESWSETSNFLQHAWITWVTRGLHVGFRRVYLSTQVDDMFLETDLYSPNGSTFRIRPADLDGHVTWQKKLNAALPPGSLYFTEVGHNGNGNIQAAAQNDTSAQICAGDDGIELLNVETSETTLEFKKIVGTGLDEWPSTPTAYDWSSECIDLDHLKLWWLDNLNTMAHVSHTFTHEGMNNATHADAAREMAFNQYWLNQTGISKAERFSASGLIPPAITGMHNGDAIQAWMDAGITSCVGDNTRPVLMNSENEHWPLITTVVDNGYAGFQINPRWATTMYFNCDLPECTVAEWIATSAGAGDIQDLLADAVATNTRHLLGLHHDPYMFHQANMRLIDVPETTVNNVTAQFSLLQMWMEVVTQEMTRLTTWPMISLKHDDIGKSFTDRMARDRCNPKLAYEYGSTNGTIIGATVTAGSNDTCITPIPVTFPGPVVSEMGGSSEQVGSDPLTVWVTLSGKPVTFTLSTPLGVE